MHWDAYDFQQPLRTSYKKNVKLYQQMKKHLYLKILSKTVLKFP